MSEPTRAETAAMIAESDEIADEIVDVLGRLLVGRGPELQGLVIADLAARWIAGHADASTRAMLIKLHMRSVRRLVPLCLEKTYPGGAHPFDDYFDEGTGHG